MALLLLGSAVRHGATLATRLKELTGISTDDLAELAEESRVDEDSDDDAEPSLHLRTVHHLHTEAQKALERERRFTMDLWAIAMNHMWLQTPSAPIRAPPIPHLHDWKSGSVGGLPHAPFQGKGDPWPAGIGTHGTSVHAVVFGFVRFAWHLKGRDAVMPIFLCVTTGVLPALQTVLLGMAIDIVSDEFNHPDDDGDSYFWKLLGCAAGCV